MCRKEYYTNKTWWNSQCSLNNQTPLATWKSQGTSLKLTNIHWNLNKQDIILNEWWNDIQIIKIWSYPYWGILNSLAINGSSSEKVNILVLVNNFLIVGDVSWQKLQSMMFWKTWMSNFNRSIWCHKKLGRNESTAHTDYCFLESSKNHHCQILLSIYSCWCEQSLILFFKTCVVIYFYCNIAETWKYLKLFIVT